MKKLMMIAAVISAFAASAEVSITDVTARQRWPWNGLVDIDFTISGAAAGEVFAIDIDATAASGATQLSAKTYATEPVAGAGTNRIVWDLGADYPEFRANDLRISVTATPYSDSTPIYMVIDLSGGPDAIRYPVRYTTSAPAHVQGAMDEPCQTTELWMRRIVPVSYAFTATHYMIPASGNNVYYGKITKPYYIGIFELTQRQYNLITGDWPAYFTNETYRASRPLENVSFRIFTGTNNDVDMNPTSITAASPLGKLRAKTGLPLNLPTNIQWEYAARGGTKLSEPGVEFWNHNVNGRQPTKAQIARYTATVVTTSPDRDSDASSGTAIVGSYLPNDYGLYDTIGNVTDCLAEYPIKSGLSFRTYYQNESGDSTLGMTTDNPVINPRGVASSSAYSTTFHRVRGGNWATTDVYLWVAGSWNNTDVSIDRDKLHGFRLAMTME